MALWQTASLKRLPLFGPSFLQLLMYSVLRRASIRRRVQRTINVRKNAIMGD
jgi:hypothetical protein